MKEALEDSSSRAGGASLAKRAAGFVARFVVMFVVLFPVAAAATNVFRVRVPPDYNPGQTGTPFRAVAIPTEDGLVLSGWLLPVTTREPRGAVLVCHGVGVNRLDVLPRAMFLVPAGYTCLLFDFRCHGASEGRRVSYGLREQMDVRAALDVLEREAPGLPVGVLAQSMGAATVILGARRYPEVRSFVLDSPFASLWEMARENFRRVPDLVGVPLQYAVSFWGSLMVGASILDISPQKSVQDLAPRPVLFIHGAADRFIPPEHSRRLHELYAGPKQLWLVPGAGHVASHHVNQAEFERQVLAHFAKSLAK